MTLAITIAEGQQRLAEYESIAKDCIKRSEHEFGKAILALYAIREEGLWHYAVDDNGIMFGNYETPKFEYYLRHFCQETGVARSTVYRHLETVSVWDRVLGRGQDELISIGIRRAAAITALIRLDARSGEVTLPPADVLESLPGNDPIEKINKKIDEVLVLPEIPLRTGDIIKSFTVDTGLAPEINFFEAESGEIWATYSFSGDYWDGPIINITMPPLLKEHIMKKLGVRRHERV